MTTDTNTIRERLQARVASRNHLVGEEREAARKAQWSAEQEAAKKRSEFEATHLGFTEDEWRDGEMLVKQMEKIHTQEETDAKGMNPERLAEIEQQTARAARRLVPTTADIAPVVTALMPTRHTNPWASSLDEDFGGGTAIRNGDNSGMTMEFFTPMDWPAALTVPSTEDTLFNPQPDRFTSHVPEDSWKDRRYNYLGNDLFPNQERRLVPHKLDKPIPTIWGFSEYMFARALMHGFNTVKHYDLVKEDKVKEIDWNAEGSMYTHWITLREYSNPHEMIDILKEFYPSITIDPDAAKRWARNGGMRLTDPEQFLADLYWSVPGAFEAASYLIETYCDVVSATRPKDEPVHDGLAPHGPDLPLIDRPRVGREGFEDYEQRVINCYRVVNDTQYVARAFGVRKATMQEWLDTKGLLVKGRGKNKRNRRRY